MEIPDKAQFVDRLTTALEELSGLPEIVSLQSIDFTHKPSPTPGLVSGEWSYLLVFGGFYTESQVTPTPDRSLERRQVIGTALDALVTATVEFDEYFLGQSDEVEDVVPGPELDYLIEGVNDVEGGVDPDAVVTAPKIDRDEDADEILPSYQPLSLSGILEVAEEAFEEASEESPLEG